MTAALGAEVSIDNLSLGEDMHRAGRPKPDGVRQAGPVSIDLARARLPAQLPYQLADVGNTRRADWVALGEQPAAGVDGDVAAKPGLATLCSTTANGRDGPSGMTSQGIQISSRLRVAPSRSLDVVRETLALIDTIHD